MLTSFASMQLEADSRRFGNPKRFIPVGKCSNMSNASLHNNDENLLEIRGSQPSARTYMAEFLRLYEHYRARAIWERMQEQGIIVTYKLRPTRV